MNEFKQEVEFFIKNKHKLESFQSSVMTFFSNHPKLNIGSTPVIHSLKTRIKDPEHLREKLRRKSKTPPINKNNLFSKINDLIGVRVLHLYQHQFEIIHKVITENVNDGEWAFHEEPKAYTWDPETKEMYDRLGIKSELKESYYTSVHYIIKPNNQNPHPICCEIQVRTLFEEIWGEIDHSINYPEETPSLACKEQLKVLSKLVSTGTRLADSIYRTYERDCL